MNRHMQIQRHKKIQDIYNGVRKFKLSDTDTLKKFQWLEVWIRSKIEE